MLGWERGGLGFCNPRPPQLPNPPPPLHTSFSAEPDAYDLRVSDIFWHHPQVIQGAADRLFTALPSQARACCRVDVSRFVRRGS